MVHQTGGKETGEDEATGRSYVENGGFLKGVDAVLVATAWWST